MLKLQEQKQFKSFFLLQLSHGLTGPKEKCVRGDVWRKCAEVGGIETQRLFHQTEPVTAGQRSKVKSSLRWLTLTH